MIVEWVDVALTVALTGALYRLAALQRRDERARSRRSVLAQRVGYANDLDLWGTLHRLPKPKREPPADRRARLRNLRTESGVSSADLLRWQDFETLVFTEQPDGRWTLEEVWDTQPKPFDAFTEAAALYAINVEHVAPSTQMPSSAPLVGIGSTHVVVTRLAAPPPLITRCVERLQAWAWRVLELLRRLRRKLAAPPPALILHAQRREPCWYPRRRFEAPHGTVAHRHPTSTHPPRPARTIRSR